MVDVLTACLSELEVIPTALLDTILMGLLPDCKAESPASYQLTQLFVLRAFGALYQPVTTFVNAVLTGQGGGGSELEEHVYHLIYELHKVRAFSCGCGLVCMHVHLSHHRIHWPNHHTHPPFHRRRSTRA